MLKYSQPLDPSYSEKILKNRKNDTTGFSEDNIKAQAIGKMFEDILNKNGKRKISISLRLHWLLDDIKRFFYDLKYSIRNHFKWRKTIREIRPWEGFDGLVKVMITHLNDYIETEEKYGHSEEEYKKNKIATAGETVELLRRMSNPDAYYYNLRQEVKSRYPEYKGLVTKYNNGGSGFSGDFIAQDNGWAGKESGLNPRAGYFEFVNGRFQLAESPDKDETERLLTQLEKYHEELANANKQAEVDSDRDFERLGQLLKENLYSWWD
ncbi:MAG: hypothetical protein FWG77_03655 [Treponema sp.]|nr:hypothetical protein [Treponema sp.]